jgi:hypothetical protein
MPRVRLMNASCKLILPPEVIMDSIHLSVQTYNKWPISRAILTARNGWPLWHAVRYCCAGG